MFSLPTLILIHGSWHRPNCYRKLTEPLQKEHGFKCISVTLASTNGSADSTFKDDLDITRAAIVGETTSGSDVVVIAHSYGGMVANSAIKGFTKPKVGATNTSSSAVSSGFSHATIQTQSTKEGYVIGLVLIASGFTLTGLSFMDPFFGVPPPSWRANKETGFAELDTPPRELFYHDVSVEEVDYWVSQLTPQSLKSLYEGGNHSYAGWQDVPVWYIGTVEDRGLPVFAQRLNVGMARQMGCAVEHRELQSGHSPFLSQPNQVIALLLEAVRAFEGEPSKKTSPELKSLQHKIAIPAARFWSPLTWFKFGLPLGFGHIVGLGIVTFLQARKLWGSYLTA